MISHFLRGSTLKHQFKLGERLLFLTSQAWSSFYFNVEVEEDKHLVKLNYLVNFHRNFIPFVTFVRKIKMLHSLLYKLYSFLYSFYKKKWHAYLHARFFLFINNIFATAFSPSQMTFGDGR